MSDLAVLRARAEAHETDLDVGSVFLTPQQLAERWHCSASTVKTIPRDELPFLEIGTGRKYRRRRYRPQDVAAYEAAHR